MNTPTRIHKGKRQILFDGVWCDVPHGYRKGDDVNAKHKAMMRAVNDAKDVLGDDEPPRWFDLAAGYQGHSIRHMIVDEWVTVTAKKVDEEVLNTIISGLIGRVDKFTIVHDEIAVTLDRKQNGK